ncbi:MAG: hypothetical protein ACLFPE_15380 [Bacteroidales bacterium]
MKTFIPPAIFFIILLVYFAACKDEAHPDFPDVEFLSPAPGANYKIYDTIGIQIRVIASAAAADLSLALVNDQDINVLPSLTSQNLEPGKTYRYQYPVSLKTLSTGNYQLRAEATAGGVKGKQYRTIYIIGLQKMLEEVWLVQQSQPGMMRVLSGSPGNGFAEIFSYPGIYGGSAISALNEKFFLGASFQGDLGAFDTDTHLLNWEIQGIQNPQQPYFTFVDYDDNRLYAGIFEGQVRGWNLDGQPAYATEQNIATKPVRMFPFREYLIIFSRQKSNETIRWLEIYFLNNGNLHVKTTLDFEPLVFAEAEANRLLMLGNDAQGYASARLLDPSDGHIGNPYQPFELPEKEMRSAAAINSQNLLFSCLDGIYRYEYQHASARIAEIGNISVLKFEEVNQLIWASDGSTVFTIAPDGQILQQTSIGPGIENLHFLYNK